MKLSKLTPLSHLIGGQRWMSLKSIDHAAVGRSAARRGCDRDAANGGRIPKVLQGFPGAVGPPALYCLILALARGSCGPDETCAGMIQGVSIWRDRLPGHTG